MDNKVILTQEEIVYYELVKMQKALEEKAQAVIEAHDNVAEMLQQFKILQKELIEKLEDCKK